MRTRPIRDAPLDPLAGPPTPRSLRLPVLVSAAAHAALLLCLLIPPRFWPDRHSAPPVLAEVELIEQNTPVVGRIRSASPGQATSLPPGNPQAATIPARPAVSVLVPRPHTAAQAMGTGLASGPQILPAALDAGVRNLPPLYPPRAVRLGQQGSVILAIVIAPDGHASAVRVLKSSGYVSLDGAARAAVATWRFLPARRAGAKITSTMHFRIRFKLSPSNGKERSSGAGGLTAREAPRVLAASTRTTRRR